MEAGVINDTEGIEAVSVANFTCLSLPEDDDRGIGVGGAKNLLLFAEESSSSLVDSAKLTFGAEAVELLLPEEEVTVEANNTDGLGFSETGFEDPFSTAPEED